MYIRVAVTYILSLCLIVASMLGTSVSVSEPEAGTCEFAQPHAAAVKDGKAMSLVQFGQTHKDMKLQTHETLSERQSGNHAEAAKVRQEPRAITFISIYDDLFETSLGTSSLWRKRWDLPHQWILINNSFNEPISKLYAKAQKQATHDLTVFLHPDVSLPNNFYDRFTEKLQKIEDVDSNWGVLGTAGTKEGSEYDVTSRITDIYGRTWRTGEDTVAVQALDEALLVLKKSSSPTFDQEMPGFDLYGIDIVLSARQNGQKSYLLNVPLFHKMWDAEGKPYKTADFEAKVKSPEYQQRVNISAKYFQKKWCSSGFLPVHGCAFYLECDNISTH